MAPPFTFTFSSGIESVFKTARLWAAKASLTSNRSTSFIFHPAKSKAFFDEGIGPVPIKAGSTPQLAQDFIETNFSKPFLSANSPDIKVTAAAPSLIPEALPAVTVPSFLKTGFNLDKASKFIPSRGCSSLLKFDSVFCDLILKFTISSLNLFST